jgi:protein-S-isoprenylcysteine O-methyltransferase Ste14
MLSGAARFTLLALNFFLGLLPGLAFFVWVERGTALPWVPISLGWPWVNLGDPGLAIRILWDVSLFALFGLLHSMIAQPRAYSVLKRVFPPQALRTLYLVLACGVPLTLMMGLWQHTGHIVWQLPFTALQLMCLSLVIYWGLLAVSARILMRFDGLEFIGLKQIYLPRQAVGRLGGPHRLVTDGIYGVVRHPTYTFTLAAFLFGPLMTLDRLMVFLASLAYLAIAIPFEEKKLVALFGEDYRCYRKRVPAVIPFWYRKKPL